MKKIGPRPSCKRSSDSNCTWLDAFGLTHYNLFKILALWQRKWQMIASSSLVERPSCRSFQPLVGRPQLCSPNDSGLKAALPTIKHS